MLRENDTNQIKVNCKNLSETLELFTEKLGFRLEMISPADSPTVAVISGHGMTLCLHEKLELEPFVWNNSGLEIPEGTNEFIVTKYDDQNSWNQGRAGMLYRDLIPSRLGGKFIASHIRIPAGGEVPDYVHYHKVRFQMIFCLSGWAKLVYEDQGAPFIMSAGDCVLQPPEIRHRVLESSAGLEVLEISSPAVHETFADHELKLPNERIEPDKIFGGQRFLHHVAAKAVWNASEIEGFEVRNTGIANASAGLADVQVFRATSNVSIPVKHSNDFLFYFVADGTLRLMDSKRALYDIKKGGSFVLAAGEEYYIDADQELEVIRVCFPV